MPPRGKIAQLPDDARAWLHRLFVEHAFGDVVEVTDLLNAYCREHDIPVTIGKSAVGAESQRVRRAQEAIRATTEAARVIAETSPDDADLRSAGAMAIAQGEIFEIMLKIRESEELDDIARLDVMNDVALALSRMSRARVNQARWADELRRAAQAAAERVAKLTRAGGLSAETQDEIRATILGIATPRAAAA